MRAKMFRRFVYNLSDHLEKSEIYLSFMPEFVLKNFHNRQIYKLGWDDAIQFVIENIQSEIDRQCEAENRVKVKGAIKLLEENDLLVLNHSEAWEIKRGLMHCINNDCNDCPYNRSPEECIDQLTATLFKE